jgi:uncharacterized membrane protein
MHVHNALLRGCYVNVSTSLRRSAREVHVAGLHAESSRPAAGLRDPRPRVSSRDSNAETVVRTSVENLAHLVERERLEESRGDRLADQISSVAGNLGFVVLNAAFFAAWILLNSGIGGLPAFDPYPFGGLTVIVSLEAIFLAIFVLMSQNRQSAAADRRASVDVHMDAIAEREITKVLEVLYELRHELTGANRHDAELADMMRPTDVQELVDAVEEAEERLVTDANASEENESKDAGDAEERR